MTGDPAPEADPEFDPLLPDQSEAAPAYKLTAEQLVSPPPHLRGKELVAWYLADLENAIGTEFIDYAGTEQPYVKRPRPNSAPQRNFAPEPEPEPPKPGTFGQGEFLL